MRAILVLGQRPRTDGEPGILEERIKKGIEIYEGGGSDCLVISEGPTVEGLEPVAVIAERYVRHVLKSDVPLMLESRARSTPENILFTKELLRNTRVEGLVVVRAPQHIRRACYLFGKLWPDIVPCVRFVGVGTLSRVERVAEIFFLFLRSLTRGGFSSFRCLNGFSINSWIG